MPDWNAYVRERLQLQGVRPEFEQNVIDDLAGQFEEAYRDAIASGLSDAEATAAAMAHVTDWRELTRQIAKSRRLASPVIDRLSIRAGDAAIEGRPRGWFLAELALTLRVAARLRRHPGYVAMSTFVLAVSVGINLLVFTVVNALWIRPLPFPEPERVVTILQEMPWTSLDSSRARIFEGGVAGQVETTDYNAGLRPQIEIAGQVPEVLGVTSSYFRVLRLTILGRDFTPGDEQDGAEPVAIVSYRLWASAFGRKADVIGAVLPAKPFPIRIIGIAPPEFEGAPWGARGPVDPDQSRPSPCACRFEGESAAAYDLRTARPGTDRADGRTAVSGVIAPGASGPLVEVASRIFSSRHSAERGLRHAGNADTHDPRRQRLSSLDFHGQPFA